MAGMTCIIYDVYCLFNSIYLIVGFPIFSIISYWQIAIQDYTYGQNAHDEGVGDGVGRMVQGGGSTEKLIQHVNKFCILLVHTRIIIRLYQLWCHIIFYFPELCHAKSCHSDAGNWGDYSLALWKMGKIKIWEKLWHFININILNIYTKTQTAWRRGCCYTFIW